MRLPFHEKDCKLRATTLTLLYELKTLEPCKTCRLVRRLRRPYKAVYSCLVLLEKRGLVTRDYRPGPVWIVNQMNLPL